MKGTISLLGSILCFLVFSSPVNANAPLYHTTFQDHSQWQVIHSAQTYSPDEPCRDANGITQWQTYPQGFGVEITASVPCLIVLARDPPLPLGSRFEARWEWYFTDTEQDRNVILNWQDADNWLGIHVFANHIFLEGKQAGQGKSIQSARFPFQSNRSYVFRAREDTRTGQIQIWVNEVLLLTATSDLAQHIPARPSLAASVGHGVTTSQSYFRQFTLWEGPQPLTLRPWKQTDPAWSETEYDSAATWSPESPTIGRWGCALVSAAIVLDYAGVKVLPSGQPLSPATLNAWLQTQSDGYLGPGFLNWRAVARLAKWHSTTHGSTALEFSAPVVPDGDKNTWLGQKLLERVPVILEQPGHFVVASGQTTNDFLIHDPASNRTLLSQYDSTFLSARLFTPSATNLQGATLLLPKWVTLTATTPFGAEVVISPLEDRPLATAPDDEGTAWQLWDIAPWGPEDLILTVQAPHPVPLLGSWYTEDGTQQELPRLLSPNQPLSLSQPSQSSILTDFELAKLMSWQEIRTPAIWLWRQEILNAPAQSDQDHYLWLLENTFRNQGITSFAYELLRAEAAEIFSQ